MNISDEVVFLSHILYDFYHINIYVVYIIAHDEHDHLQVSFSPAQEKQSKRPRFVRERETEREQASLYYLDIYIHIYKQF